MSNDTDRCVKCHRKEREHPHPVLGVICDGFVAPVAVDKKAPVKRSAPKKVSPSKKKSKK